MMAMLNKNKERKIEGQLRSAMIVYMVMLTMIQLL